jgi:ATP phosphoribosyltransferase
MNPDGRLRLAIPNKGRLAEPSVALLRDAGMVFDEHDRRLVAHVENLELDILFVNATDIVEFVEDGVADLGITGQDLLAESESRLSSIRELDYGHCRLALAVPNGAKAAGAADVAGSRVATAHPNAARRWFEAQGVDVDVIRLSGAVEVAPKLGLADAIVDLVSTGSTLAMNGLRPIADILPSQAVLVVDPASRRQRESDIAAVDTMLAAVVAARGRKYLMMNAPSARLAELRGLLPALGSPSVIPLAEEGMIAIHSVVGAAEVWDLLPRLRAAGASGILVLPIEKLVA